VAGRGSVWCDERLVDVAGRFVAAADETWRLQRGTDDECRFFQELTAQGHYRGSGTRQGIYVATPGGELLGSINSLDPDAVLAMIERALAAWDALPMERRWLAEDARIEPAHRWEDNCPVDDLLLERFARDLPASGDPGAPRVPRWNPDHAWFTAREARAWLPPDPRPGDVHAVPASSVERLARFHLVDNVRGQTLPFAREEVGGSTLSVEVLSRDGERVELALSGTTRASADGKWLMGESDWTPPGRFPRGISTELLGRASYDLAAGVFTAFELVALGERWGRSHLNGRRDDEEGRLGFVLRLAPRSAAGRIAPAFIDVYDAAWVVPPAGP
jgi:hypothetical protein